MQRSRDSFDSPESQLVRLFVQRGSCDTASAEQLVISLVEDLRKSAQLQGFAPSLESLLRLRRISLEYVDDLECDGLIQPLGIKYEDGFKMLVKSKCLPRRTRFTTAHEICHTLFYEVVPEIKFRNHDVDRTEERLCNIGAAALLIPAGMLKSQVKGAEVSFETLEKLSELFDVSLEAMFLRLRFLEIWGAELSTWRLMTGGKFFLHRLIGGRKAEWTWCEAELLRKAWGTRRPLRGRTYLECRDSDGCLKVRAVSYELRRCGDTLQALWSHPSIRRTHPKMPLFEAQESAKIRVGSKKTAAA